MARFEYARKSLASGWALWVAGFCYAVLKTDAQIEVTQEHNHLSRDGFYIDSAFTPSDAANVARDLNFDGTISGNVYAQPLYIEGGPNGPIIITVTESNNVYALNPITGAVVWQRNVGPAVARSQLPCGNIDPLGISDTPVVDLASRSLFLDAMTTPDGGTTKEHLVFSLNVDTGATNAGWPVNLNSAVPGFTSSVQNNRGALALANGIVYIPFSGHAGDCGMYHGWVVGVAPTNWLSLDNGDTDLGGCSAILIDVPGATPSQLVLALGKDGYAYLLDRNNLGGITAPVASFNTGAAIGGQAAATYRTSQGTYFAFRQGGSAVQAYRITATNPPTIVSAWSASQSGQGSPWVTTTDGTNNPIVWVVGTESDNRLHGYDGQTGAVVFAGGGANELMSGTRKWNTGIVARGRIYFAADNRVYAFAAPTPTPNPTPIASDFNRDGKPDYLLFQATSQRTSIWYMNNNLFVSSASGPTLPAGWRLADVADFNRDGKPDYVLFNASTRQTAIWYLNNNVYVSGAYGPTLPANWYIAGAADFDRNGAPDYLLFDSGTRQTAIWYLNNNSFLRGAYGPTIASGYVLTGTADFNADGKPDYVLSNDGTRRTAIWHLNNNVFVDGTYGPTLSSGFSLVAP